MHCASRPFQWFLTSNSDAFWPIPGTDSSQPRSLRQGGAANQWAKWKAELERGTDLSVCLEGLFDTLQDCCSLAMAGGAEE